MPILSQSSHNLRKYAIVYIDQLLQGAFKLASEWIFKYLLMGCCPRLTADGSRWEQVGGQLPAVPT